MQSWRETLRLYLDKRLAVIFLFGIASGFPFVMMGSAANAWLKDEGISRSAIGFFGLVFAVYSINFLWSPLVDRVKLPVLQKLMGQRRSWIFVTQLVVIACCALMSQFTEITALQNLGLVAFILAIAASTQDIAIDAFRIDSFAANETEKLSAAAAMATAGWWTGYAGLGAIPFFFADKPGWDWPSVYLLLAAIMSLLAIVNFFAKEPQTAREQVHDDAYQIQLRAVIQQPGTVNRILLFVVAFLGLIVWHFSGFAGMNSQDSTPASAHGVATLCYLAIVVMLVRQLSQLHQNQSSGAGTITQETGLQRGIAWVLVTVVTPFEEFFRRNGVKFALSILLFIFLFKLGEAYLGRMSVVFYKEVGFTNEEIGLYSKLINWWVTIFFAIVGSLVTMKFGIYKGLMTGGIAMASSNLMFSWLAVSGPVPAILISAVIVDGFTTAWSSVAFVAFLSLMCNRAFSATQYALMVSLGTLGRTLLGSSSGWLVDLMDGNWALFFILTAAMVIPSLCFLYMLRERIGQLEAQSKLAEQ